MSTPTDLRAALRDAAETLARVKPIDLNVGDDPHGLAERCRALADAPPTVAELLPMVDATHEVHWRCSIEDDAECRAVLLDKSILIEWRHVGNQRWRGQPMTAADLNQPATLVEVSP